MTNPKHKLAKSVFGDKYMSDPFQVMLASFKAVWKINITAFWMFLAVSLLSLLLASLTAVAILDVYKFELGMLWMVPLLAGLIIWAIVLLGAFTRYALATAKGQTIEFSQALKIGYQKASGYGGLMLVTAAIVIGGLVLLIIPGLVFAYWFLLAPYIYMGQEVTIRQALRQSKKIVTAQPAEIFGLLGVGIIFSLGGLVPVLGFVYSIVFNIAWYVAWAYRYQSGAKLLGKPKSKPATSPANYWALALMVVALFIMAAASGSA